MFYKLFNKTIIFWTEKYNFLEKIGPTTYNKTSQLSSRTQLVLNLTYCPGQILSSNNDKRITKLFIQSLIVENKKKK